MSKLFLAKRARYLRDILGNLCLGSLLLDHLHLIHPVIRHGHAILAIDLHDRGRLHQLVNSVIQLIYVVWVRATGVLLERRGDRILDVDFANVFL